MSTASAAVESTDIVSKMAVCAASATLSTTHAATMARSLMALFFEYISAPLHVQFQRHAPHRRRPETADHPSLIREVEVAERKRDRTQDAPVSPPAPSC